MRAFPGVAKGQILDQQITGRYTHSSGLWLDATVVENDSDQFLEHPQFTPTVGASYFYIDDTGAIRSATYADLPAHNARVAFGNYFKFSPLATRIRNKMADLFDERADRGV